MLERKSAVNQIEITENGTVQVRIALLLIEGGAVLLREWHRTSFPPGVDVDAMIVAVNDHLKRIGRSNIEQEDIVKIKSVTNLAHTPEAIRSYQEAQKKAEDTL